MPKHRNSKHRQRSKPRESRSLRQRQREARQEWQHRQEPPSSLSAWSLQPDSLWKPLG